MLRLVSFLHPPSLTNLVKNLTMSQGSDCISTDTDWDTTNYAQTIRMIYVFYDYQRSAEVIVKLKV